VYSDVREELIHLERMAVRAFSVTTLTTLRGLAVETIVDALGPGYRFVGSLEAIQAPPMRSPIAAFLPIYPAWAMRRSLLFVLRHIIRTLEVEAAAVGASVDAPSSRPLTADANARLQEMIGEVLREVEATPLDGLDRTNLLAALDRALAILRGETAKGDAREALRELLGEAVASAGRGGRAAPLWRRIAEVVVVAEAAVSLGLGVAAITSARAATRVEVTCRIGTPALPPGAEVPATPPRALPPGTGGLDGPLPR
jgi:hypothetical protein